MTVNHDVAGSNPASGASGLFVKWLRHRPFTAGSGVRIPHRSPIWAISSAGRASALQAECQQFDPVIAHHQKRHYVLRAVVSFCFPFSFIGHLTSCIRDSLCLARRFRSFKTCSLQSQFDPVIAHHQKRHYVLRAVVFFVFPFFSLEPFTSCPPSCQNT